MGWGHDGVVVKRLSMCVHVVSASLSISIIEHKCCWNKVVAYPICRSVCPESVLWQNG